VNSIKPAERHVLHQAQADQDGNDDWRNELAIDLEGQPRLRVTGNSGQLFPFVGEFLATFKDYPPRQKAASFTVDQVLQSLQQNNGGN
jgi:hypothetical protein